MNDIMMGTSLPYAERKRQGLMGRMPHKEESLAQQRRRIYRLVSAMQSPFDQHLLLRQLQEDNPVLFYDLVRHHLPELLPIIYTPVVGEACQRHSDLYLRSHGLYLSWHDRDDLDDILESVEQEVDVIVISDGERVLGLGDLGIGGMGICIGKLALYSAAGGINPARTLPLCVDVGTNNPELLEDDSYLGWQSPRIDGESYYHFMDKVVAAIRKRWPQVVLQFEDFAGKHAANLLTRYRDELCMFNDDIQGTAAVASACVLAGLQQAGTALSDAPVLIVGAGSAGCGIAAMLAQLAGSHDGVWLFDQDGVVCSDRPNCPCRGGGEQFAAGDHPAGAPGGLDWRERAGWPLYLRGAAGDGGGVRAAGDPATLQPDPQRRGYPRAGVGRHRWPRFAGHRQPLCAGDGGGGAAGGIPVQQRLCLSGDWSRSLRRQGAPHQRWHVAGRGAGSRSLSAGGRLLPPIEQVGEVARAVARAVALCAREEGLADFVGDPAPLIDQTWWHPHYWAAS